MEESFLVRVVELFEFVFVRVALDGVEEPEVATASRQNSTLTMPRNRFRKAVQPECQGP